MSLYFKEAGRSQRGKGEGTSRALFLREDKNAHNEVGDVRFCSRLRGRLEEGVGNMQLLDGSVQGRQGTVARILG